MHKEPDISWEDYQAMCDSFLDILREDMEGYLDRQEYSEVNKFLSVAVVPATDHAILVEILRITFPHAAELSERRGFYDRVRSEVRLTRSESDADKLLKRYI